MTNDKREALIEEAAKAIYSNERESIEGAHDWPEWDNCRPSSRESVLEAARAALAVFEQAHRAQGANNFPQNSDDERDELEVQDLATVIGNVVIDYEGTGPHSQRPITIRDTCADWPMEIAGEVQAAGFRRPVQGEPSDAQVNAALLGYFPEVAGKPELQDWGKNTRERMRAALRAAFQTGESRG